MTLRYARRYHMLVRLRNFGAAHARLFPDTSTAHAAFAEVGAEIARLEELDVAERSAMQSSRAGRKRAARKALAVTLTRAGSTARVLAKANPALEARINLPLPFDGVQLLTIAREFAAAAAPCAAGFAVHGIPLAELEGRIAAFEQAVHERGLGRDERVKARAEIEASFSRAMDAVEVLDVTVANSLSSDAVALAVWKFDRRMNYPQRVRNAGEEQPATEPEIVHPAQDASASPVAA
jgi:hypothetical protein